MKTKTTKALAGLTDDDLKAIFAYLRTVPAVRNQVHAPEVPGDIARFE
jgi:hypothetical protein